MYRFNPVFDLGFNLDSHASAWGVPNIGWFHREVPESACGCTGMSVLRDSQGDFSCYAVSCAVCVVFRAVFLGRVRDLAGRKGFSVRSYVCEVCVVGERLKSPPDGGFRFPYRKNFSGMGGRWFPSGMTDAFVFVLYTCVLVSCMKWCISSFHGPKRRKRAEKMD